MSDVIGTQVTVVFKHDDINTQFIKGKLIYTPGQPGDCYVIETAPGKRVWVENCEAVYYDWDDGK